MTFVTLFHGVKNKDVAGRFTTVGGSPWQNSTVVVQALHIVAILVKKSPTMFLLTITGDVKHKCSISSRCHVQVSHLRLKNNLRWIVMI